MELVPEIVGTCSPTVSIIHTEEGAPGPELCLLKLGLDYVQNYRDAILIVISDDALMSVRCV